MSTITFTGHRPTDVTFKYDSPSAKTVNVAGTFNNWALVPMTKNGDSFEVVVKKVHKGKYQFKFIVDDVWTLAEFQTTYDGQGNKNHFFEIPEGKCPINCDTCFPPLDKARRCEREADKRVVIELPRQYNLHERQREVTIAEN